MRFFGDMYQLDEEASHLVEGAENYYFRREMPLGDLKVNVSVSVCSSYVNIVKGKLQFRQTVDSRDKFVLFLEDLYADVLSKDIVWLARNNGSMGVCGYDFGEEDIFRVDDDGLSTECEGECLGALTPRSFTVTNSRDILQLFDTLVERAVNGSTDETSPLRSSEYYCCEDPDLIVRFCFNSIKYLTEIGNVATPIECLVFNEFTMLSIPVPEVGEDLYVYLPPVKISCVIDTLENDRYTSVLETSPRFDELYTARSI